MNIESPTEKDKILVNELLNAIDAGNIAEQTIEQFRYEHLRALLRYATLLDGGQAFYIKIKHFLEDISIRKLKKKEKLRVAFVVSGIPVWCGDELYNLLDKSELFEPYIYVFLHNIGQSVKMMLDEYDEHVKVFRDKGMRVIDTINRAEGIIYTWEQIGEFPDICIWTTPWIYAHVPQQCFTEYPLSTIHTYIPYGYILANNEENDYVQMQYNYEFHNLVWKIFAENAIAVEMAEKYAFTGKENTVYTGAPKMDVFFESLNSDPWEDVINTCGNKNAKRIIYAPHHSMQAGGNILWATFQDNYRIILELAKKYENDTVWLFKPHPALKFKSIYVGLFKDETEWDAYVQEWRDLKNGMVYEGADYPPFFRCSDAMILDCASFIAEYLYVNKPALFLRRKEQNFNELGRKLLTLLYQADGINAKDIEDFIQNVVLDGMDNKQKEREAFFEGYINYRRLNGKEQSAATNIYGLLYSQFMPLQD